MKLTLPTDSAVRKDVPMFSGAIKYFPAAIAGVAKHSKEGNDKHNPGEPLHHARGKSSDHADCIVRHLTDLADMIAAFERAETFERVEPILAEANALCWRALAFSQELHERLGGAPLAPGAKLPNQFEAVDLTKFDGLVDGDIFEIRFTGHPFKSTERRLVRDGFVLDDAGGRRGEVDHEVYQLCFVRYLVKAPR